MAYKVKYRLDYCNKEKLNARLDFEIKDYTSTIIHDIVGTQDAFSYKVRNEKPDRSGYFRTLEADINIFEDENFNIDNLLTSDETAIRVKFYIENQLEFVGFIIPDFFEVSIDKPRVISMVASDRIGTLKNQTLPRETGIQSFRYMLEQSLLKTGLNLPLNSTINFNPVGETGDFLTKTGGLMERLSSDKGASISCYDIIKSILIVSNSFLVQSKGQWHILNKLEYESRPKTKDIEQINVGGRRLINPPSSKVGVMAEFGGTPNYPKNHNFKTLEGWTARYGFNVEINDKQVEEIVGSNVTYGDNFVNNSAKCFGNTHMWNVSDETLNPALESSRARVFSLNTQLIDAKLSINATVAHNSVGTNVDYIYFRYTIFAESTSETLYYDGNSFRKYGSKPKESGWITAEKLDGNGAQEINQSVNFSLEFDDIDNPKNVNDYSFYVRIYGAGTDNTVFLNLVKIEFQDKEEHPKGNLYKIEQGVNFTKESDIDTTVFGGYINKGVNGYFYNYQRDELNQIYYKIGSRWESFGLKWQTANNNTADYLLLHSVRQRAVMFSAPHNIITAVIKGKFSPLDIYSVCGVKYVLVEANYDFYRNETELRIEEIKYDNSVLKTDFIYSYFGGEDTTSISGVSNVGSSSGGGGSSFQSLIKIDDDGNYYVEENFYSLKDVSAFGKDDLGGGGGGDGVALTSWIDQITTLTDFNQNTKFIKQSEVVDNLTSNLSNLPLSARQGMILKNFIDNIEVGEGGQVVVDWDSILGKPSTFAPSAHSHIISDVTDLQVALDAKTSKTYVDDGLATKENTFSKNTAFNRNFGTTAGTVATGNHTHTFASLTGKPTTLAGYGITDGAKSVDVDAHITDKANPHSVTKTQIGLSNVLNVKQATKTEFDTFKNLFDSLFELDGDYIKAKKSLYSTGDLSAFGKDNLGGGGTGGGTDLVSWEDQIMTLTDFNVGSNFTTQSDIDSAIDGIEIGGRNLLLNTKNERSGGYYLAPYYTLTEKPIVGESYTLSGWFKFSEGNLKRIMANIAGVGDNLFTWRNDAWVYEEWFYFSRTFTWSGESANDTSIYIYGGANDSLLSYGKLIKLEKGNKATDWTPAPEDQVSDWNSTNSNSFDFIKNKPTKLSQFSNVETDFVNKTYVDNTFTTISNFNTHTSNTTLHKTQSDREAIASFLSMFEMDGDFIKAKKSLYSVGDLSAFGKDNLGGGAGGTDLVSWIDQITTLTDFNQSTNFINIQQVEAKDYATNTRVDGINSRLTSVEGGSVMTVTTSGSGNAITSISKSGTVITATKGDTFSKVGHSHAISDITNLQTQLNSKASNTTVNGISSRLTTVESNYTTQSDIDSAIDGIEIGGRNLFYGGLESGRWSTPTGEKASDSSKLRCKQLISVKPNTHYIITNYSASSSYIYLLAYGVGGAFVKYVGAQTGQYRFTTEADTYYITFYVDINTGASINDLIKLEKGNKPTDWTPAPEDQISGGRNYLLDSSFQSGTQGGYITAYGTSLSVSNNILKSTVTEGGRAASRLERSLFLGNTGTFTYSIKIKGTTTASDFRFNQFVGLNYSNKYYDITGDWQILHITFENETVGDKIIRIYFPLADEGDFVEVDWDALVIGNNPMIDWTPAPEDQVSDWSTTNVASLSYIKNKPTQLSQFTDNIGVGSHIANKANPHAVTTAQIGAVDLTTNQSIGGVKTFTSNVGVGILNPYADIHILGKQETGGNASLRISNPTQDDSSAVSSIVFTHRQSNSNEMSASAEFGRGGKIVSGREGVYGGAISNHNSNLQFYTSSSGVDSEHIRIKSNGNVGIGTTSPSEKLDVIGNIKASGSLTALGGNSTNWNSAFAHISVKTNPHDVTKTQVGLGNVTNESKATMFTNPTFTGTTKVTILELNTNWKFVKVGNNIELQYNGVTKQEMTSEGHIIAHGDVTALLDN